MTQAHVLTVADGGADDRSGREIARALAALGVLVVSRQVVDASEAALEPALRGVLEARGLVVVLAKPGGSEGELVPRVVGRLTGARLVLNERRLASIEAFFTRRGQAMPRRLDRLALLPRGAELLGDDAQGWSLAGKHGALLVLPLDAPDLARLVTESSRTLPAVPGGDGQVLRVLLVTGLSAAEVEERLGSWLGKEGDVSVSCAPVEADVHVRLLGRGATRALASAALQPVEAEVRAALGVDCYGQDEDLLETVVGRLLLARGFTVSVAESCTGGLLGNRLTNIAGSSRYIERGVIVYSNRAKEELLGVPEPLLRAHGAVSEPVARAMAEGVCRISGSPCGLAVTGIAGPDGGSAEKPVGTVYIGCATPEGIEVRRCRFDGDRVAIKWQSSQTALDMLRRRLGR
ncbi:MAG TPA: nicotinamide-nucleotide amidohydrolase family protein [Methylomirabilota bacterium]|nr:nicotinamide-nucleotide amidohydrolase family protein [Methylomirabilota bacterium]